MEPMSNGAAVHQPHDIEDGIHDGMSREEYGRIEAVNYSLLKHFAKSAAHARHEMLSPSDPTESMDLGTAAHCAVFEPGRFAEEYVLGPNATKRTNAGKAVWAEFEERNRGKGILELEEMEACQAMSRAVYAHEIVGPLLAAPGKNEVVVLWHDAETGLRCKAMLDRLAFYAGWVTIADLKTCRDARPWAFAKMVSELLYHVQAAFYLDGLNTVAPAERKFLWIAIEKEQPYGIRVYDAGMIPETIEQGRAEYREYLRSYKLSQETGRWNAYPAVIEPLSLPRYTLTHVGASDVD